MNLSGSLAPELGKLSQLLILWVMSSCLISDHIVLLILPDYLFSHIANLSIFVSFFFFFFLPFLKRFHVEWLKWDYTEGDRKHYVLETLVSWVHACSIFNLFSCIFVISPSDSSYIFFIYWLRLVWLIWNGKAKITLYICNLWKFNTVFKKMICCTTLLPSWKGCELLDVDLRSMNIDFCE